MKSFRMNITSSFNTIMEYNCIPLAWCPIVGIDIVKERMRTCLPPDASQLRCIDDWRVLDDWQLGSPGSGIPP